MLKHTTDLKHRRMPDLCPTCKRNWPSGCSAPKIINAVVWKEEKIVICDCYIKQKETL